MKTRSLLPGVVVVSAALSIAACGNGGVKLHPITNEPSCTAAGLRVVPGDGAGPLHRMTPVVATWTGDTDGVDIVLTVADEAVDGEVLVDEGRAMFVPAAPLPENSAVAWTVTTCNATRSGAFVTGALVEPVHARALDDLVGRPFAMDLRAATWVEPKPRDGLAEVNLRWRLAPAMFVMLNDIQGKSGTFALVPAVIDKTGAPAPDLTRATQLVRAPLANNPYVALAPDDISFAMRRGVVTLRYIDLIVGLGKAGLEDGRLSAEVDLRELDGVAQGCNDVAALTGTACYACDENDKVGSCFLLEMRDIVGMPTDAILGDIPQPRGGAAIPRATLDAPPVAIDEPVLDTPVVCPDGLCPPRPVTVPPRAPIAPPDPQPAPE